MATVDEAIRKARKMFVYPTMLIVVGNLVMAFICADNDFPKWTFVMFLVAAPVLGWIYWGLYSAKWRIWAFGNVRNVHELRRKAVRYNWMRDAEFSGRTRFVNAKQQLQLQQLEKKFSQDDVYHEDLSVTVETQIFFSKPVAVMAYLFASAFSVIGIYVSVATGTFFPLVFFVPAGAFLFYRVHKRFGTRRPQLVINAIGIRVGDKSLIEWQDIRHYEIVSRREGKYDKEYLVISHHDGVVEIGINDLATDTETLEHQLEVHRFRFGKSVRGK